MSLELLAKLLGGVGLFLLGMRLMTEGLRVAAGPALREILSRSTRTRLRGVASGFLVTSLVQSSSAVTVATIGFVNAGLLTLGQAIAVTYGSNIGTTTTGWLVATIGLHVNVRAFALPLVGIGMALRLFTSSGRSGPFGEALAGFGIFFLGIDVLKGAFEGLGERIDFSMLADVGAIEILVCVLIGFGLTFVMQSSSAAIAIILTAAGGDVVSLASGAAAIIGANVGTTSTAALAVIGATSNARRMAAGHLAFNLITGITAIGLLPFLLLSISRAQQLLEWDSQPVAVLAAFHTVFNLLGVALLWPVTARLLRFLESRFRDAEEDEARLRYLDRNVIVLPVLARDAMVMELTRVGQVSRRLARAALRGDRGAPAVISSGRLVLMSLVESIGEYGQLLHRARLPSELDVLPSTTLRVLRYYSEAAEIAETIARSAIEPPPAIEDSIDQAVRRFLEKTELLVQQAGLDEAGYESEAVAAELAGLQADYQSLKGSLLEAGGRGALGVQRLVSMLDWLSNVRRLAEQVERGTRFLASLVEPLSEDAGDSETPADSDEWEASGESAG